MNRHNMKIGLVTAVMLLMVALPMAPVSAATAAIDIGDSGYEIGGQSADNLLINTGDDITFTNIGTSPTTITSGDGTTCDTGEMAAGSGTGTCTFSAVGTYVLTDSAGSHTLNVSVEDANSGGGGEEGNALMDLSPTSVSTVVLDRADLTDGVDDETLTISTIFTWTGSNADTIRSGADSTEGGGDGDGTVSTAEADALAAMTDTDSIPNPVVPVRTGSGPSDPEGADLGSADSSTVSWSGVTGSTTSGTDVTLSMVHVWNLQDTDDQWGGMMRISVGFAEDTEYTYDGTFSATDGVNREIDSCRDGNGNEFYDAGTDDSACSTSWTTNDPYTGYSLIWDLGRDDGFTDTDNDGIADSSDMCPNDPDDNTTSTANSTHGCPDTDDDGVHDGLDNCPTEHDSTKEVDANGCDIEPTAVDTDDDGWNDNVDMCPSTVGTYNGCPDTDGDGVHDGLDACDSEAPTTDEDGDGCEDTVDIVYHMVHVEYGETHVMGNVSNGTSIAEALSGLNAPALGASADDMAADDPRHSTYSLCRVMTVGGEETCTSITDASTPVTGEMMFRLTASNSSGDAKVHVVAAAGDITVSVGDWLYITGHTACNDADGDGTCEDTTATFTSLEIISEDDLTLVLTPGGSSMTVTVGTSDGSSTSTTTTTTGTTDTAAEDEGALPGFGLVIGLTATLGAALIAARRD